MFFESPIFATTFYMVHPVEDATVREKFGQESGENRSRRRHRGGRRGHSGKQPSGGGQSRPAEDWQPDKKPAGKARPPQSQQAKSAAGDGEAKRRKPYYRGGRRRGKGGGGGTPPKAE